MHGVAGLLANAEGEVVGTAFLVEADLALTAFHCVGDRDTGILKLSRVFLRLPEVPDLLPARVVANEVDPRLDVACLRLERPAPPDQRVAVGIEIKVGAACLSVGYPWGAFTGGDIDLTVATVGGTIRNPEATLKPDVPAIQWRADEAAAGLPLGGLSGAPLLVEAGATWTAVGLVRWNPPSVADDDLAAGGIVVATPMTAIVKRWPELGRLIGRGSGVVLSAFADGRLVNLARPVLEELHFRVTDLPLAETFSKRDLATLQSADVVLADLTGSKFGVLEKLIIARRLGVPDVIVMFDQTTDQPPVVHFPFAITSLKLGDPADSQGVLRGILRPLAELVLTMGQDASDAKPNQFFNASLTRVSAAYGLAMGYFTNFARVVSKALERLAEDGDVAITIGDKNGQHGVSPEEARTATLDVVLPKRLSWASDEAIVRACRGRGLVPAFVDDKGLSRKRSMWAWPDRDQDGTLRLIDPFPTTMSPMQEAIDDLLGTNKDERTTSLEWGAVEIKEVSRFGANLMHLIGSESTRLSNVRVLKWPDVFREPDLADFPGM